MKIEVSNEDIRYLRRAYKAELARETQASEGCKDLWRKTIAIFDELLKRRAGRDLQGTK